MKKETKKQRLKKLLWLAVAIAVFLGFGACKEDEEKLTECNHTKKDHLGYDQAEGSCADICDCTRQKGTIPETTIVIQKQSGVSVEDMDAAILIIQAAYNNYKGSIDVTGINVTSKGYLWEYDNNKVIWMYINEVKTGYNFDNFLGAIMDGYLNPGDKSTEIIS